MNSFLTEQMKMMDKSNNLSKNNLSKKLRNLKLITEYSKKRKYQKEKINLKFRNSYKYDINNIMNRTNRSSKSKIKKPERNYSSFYSKTTNYLDSDLFPPNLNHENKINTKKLYTRIFSSNTNYTDNRIESSDIKSKRKRNNSSYRAKNIRGLHLDLNYSNMKFNNNAYNKLLINQIINLNSF